MALYICCGDGYSQFEFVSERGIDEASRSRGSDRAWFSERVLVRPAGIRLRGLYFESIDCCGGAGRIESPEGCEMVGVFRRGWFGSLTGHADGISAPTGRLKGESLASDLPIGHDGGGLGIAEVVFAEGIEIVPDVVSAQNQPIVVSTDLNLIVDCTAHSADDGSR